MNILIALFLVVFEAVPEALYDEGRKTLAGVFEFVYRAVVTLVLFAWMVGVPAFHAREQSLLILLIGYVLLRFALFDYIYNAIRGVELNYIGTTKLWDRFLRSLKIHPSLLLFIRGIAFLWGASWLLGWMDGIVNVAKSIF
jgi:hypothetical protein